MSKTEQIRLKPLKIERIRITIEGTSPLLQHRWSDKAKRMMREKGAGRKTKDREVRNPEAEAQEAMYVDRDGNPGVPLMAVKTALVDAAHKDLGIEKTLVRKAMFFIDQSAVMLTPLQYEQLVVREDTVRVGMGSADLRYRPEFHGWSCDLLIEFDADLLRAEDIVNLLARAGFGIGIGEWRPEKGGVHGRFRVRQQ